MMTRMGKCKNLLKAQGLVAVTSLLAQGQQLQLQAYKLLQKVQYTYSSLCMSALTTIFLIQ